MKPEEFEAYRRILKEKSGIIVTVDKTYLLESRLTPVAKKHGFESLDTLNQSVLKGPAPAVVNDIIEAMTTNETSFFRDKTPFDNFGAFCIPHFLKTRATKRFKIWCAAASSGQEPYSLRILMKERPDMIGWNVDMVGTDLSNDILAQAKGGLYSQFEVQRGLPIQLLVKYFTQDGDKWRIKDEIRNSITYKQLNLLDSYAAMGKFDAIFCRNVLIYFDEATKADILKRLAAQLEPDGYLFLGGAETVLGITDAFVPLPGARGLYVTKNSAHLQSAAAVAPPVTRTLAS